MVSLITDLKLSGYSAAISALATFAERDASASGASLTIGLSAGPDHYGKAERSYYRSWKTDCAIY
jgi:hypothetical protein